MIGCSNSKYLGSYQNDIYTLTLNKNQTFSLHQESWPYNLNLEGHWLVNKDSLSLFLLPEDSSGQFIFKGDSLPPSQQSQLDSISILWNDSTKTEKEQLEIFFENMAVRPAPLNRFYLDLNKYGDFIIIKKQIRTSWLYTNEEIILNRKK
jgi:hypothetical protein